MFGIDRRGAVAAPLLLAALLGCVQSRHDSPVADASATPSAISAADGSSARAESIVAPAPSGPPSAPRPSQILPPDAARSALEHQDASASLVSPKCEVDTDCKAVADRCAVCACAPLPRDAVMPKCSGKGVACFVDSCRGKRAVCRKGQCALESDALR
jgi:hypothetical protein